MRRDHYDYYQELTKEMIPELFAIKAQVERENDDIEMFFIWPEESGLLFDYYLSQVPKRRMRFSLLCRRLLFASCC